MTPNLQPLFKGGLIACEFDRTDRMLATITGGWGWFFSTEDTAFDVNSSVRGEMMRRYAPLLSLMLLASTMYSQTDRETVTGAIADPAGAVVASAPAEARNLETGALYQAATSATGN
jgi:hypothetical protein